MNTRYKLIMRSVHILILVLLLTLLFSAAGFLNPGPEVRRVTYLTRATLQIGSQPRQRVTLPCTLKDLPPRTPVTFSAVIYPDPDEEIYIKSNYWPGKVYLNDRLGYEFGEKDRSPAFMLDPAAEIHMIETHGSGQAMTLRMELQSPRTQKRMIIEPPLMGSTKEIILERFHTHGGRCVLATAQALYGFSLILVSMCTQLLDKKGASFLWLGLLSLLSGLWAFGVNEFSGVILKNSTLLYLFAHCGFFCFLIPLLRFSRCVVDYENPRPICRIELFVGICACLAMLTQLLGLVAFSTSLPFFYLILPPVLLFLLVYTIREYVKFHKTSALRFLLPAGVLTVTAIGALTAYLFSAMDTIGAFTQMGMLLFLLLVGVTAGLSLKDSIELKNRQKQLDFEKNLIEIQVQEQENHSRLLSRQEEILSQQRHDLRHHLSVIQALSSPDNTELQSYLQTLIEGIPTSSRRFCENQAVNAILSHYSMLCSQKGIELILNLSVPEEPPHITSSSLCVIFGNLLENAVEACDRMESGRKFIKLRSRLQGQILTVTMDNSFNGRARQEGQRFRSSKRDSLGIGLQSIRSMAQTSGGDADFHPDGKVFLSSVYLNL